MILKSGNRFSGKIMREQNGTGHRVTQLDQIAF
jgi:hypothetical protein